MGSWGVTMRQSDYGLDLLGTIVDTQLKAVNFLTFKVADALEVIKADILKERPKGEDNNVFIRAYPPYTRIASTSPLDYMIDKYCRLAGVEKKRRRSFHSLRRAFGTELAEAEVPVTSISQMLGHSKISSGKAYLSFNRTQTALCSADFSEVPISKGIYADMIFQSRHNSEKGGAGM